MTGKSMAFAAALLLAACGGDAEQERRYSPEECSSLRDPVLQLLQDNVRAGILLGTAVPCGSDGVADNRSAFDARTSQADMAQLQAQFADLCSDFAAHCD
jgi:hypothetical protein